MAVAQDTVTVYSTTTCPWCVRAKEYLKQKGVPFQEKNIEHDPVAAREIMQRTGQMGVPVITAGSDVIIGFDRARLDQLAKRYAASAPAEDAVPPPPPPKIGLRVKDASGGAEVGAVHPAPPPRTLACASATSSRRSTPGRSARRLTWRPPSPR